VNLLLLHPEELQEDGTVRLSGRRLKHAREVLEAAEGDELRVGVLHGKIGTARVARISDDELVLEARLDADPPPRSGAHLILALPRPKALRKILPAVASLGVTRVVLVNAARVEKSYFDSKALDEAPELFEQGLEQARDTRPPELLVRPLFRPFVEDELDALSPPHRLLAHPVAPPGIPPHPGEFTLAVGPEGGWVPFELQLLEQRGFVPFSLGPRILRTEVAVPFLLGKLSV
jgi:RsmE family RNA methyltransferase